MPEGGGRSVRRLEDQRLLTGKGSYTADLSPPGLLHAVLVRSPYAHADIVSVDTEAARAMPGVWRASARFWAAISRSMLWR